MEESRKYTSDNFPNMFETIQDAAIAALRDLVDVAEGKVRDHFLRSPHEGTALLEMIGCINIVSDQHNPGCQKIFAAGLLDLIVADRCRDKRESIWCILQSLISARCVNKAMLVGMVRYGMVSVKSYEDAHNVVEALRNALVPIAGQDIEPSDELYSDAIKSGFIEMSLTLLVRFGASGTRVLSNDRMLDALSFLLDSATKVACFKKPSKAIRERRSEIQKVLLTTVGKTENRTSELVAKVRWIVSINMGIERSTGLDGSGQTFCQ